MIKSPQMQQATLLGGEGGLGRLPFLLVSLHQNVSQPKSKMFMLKLLYTYLEETRGMTGSRVTGEMAVQNGGV